MLFTSIEYFIFLLASLIVFYVTPVKYRNYILILASLIFYMYVKVSYVLIIVSIITANYFIGIKIETGTDKLLKTRYLYLGLLINLGILVYFKYWNSIIDNYFDLFYNNSLKNKYLLAEVILPLGLSYYIFQTIGYILDIYRGSIKAEKDFLKFSLFTLFFPKLLVGPIERAKNLLPQIAVDHLFIKENIIAGSKTILWGIFKKIVVAERISLYVDAVYSNLPNHNSLTFYFATFLYPIQVYADFSGYTDMALGSAKLFGYDLMDNFKRPLFAKNVSDFWRRWHISLSTWVNDYIYKPITYQRRDWGNIGVFYALLISFVVIGIWHGATWNFVVFGILQASALIFEVLTKNVRKKISGKITVPVYNIASIILTFLFFSFSLIVFRTTTIAGAANIVNIMFSAPGEIYVDNISTIIYIAIGSVILLIADLHKENGLFGHFIFQNNKWVLQQIFFSFLVIYILVAGVFDGGQFIYFAF